jgi:hypothetical protein
MVSGRLPQESCEDAKNVGHGKSALLDFSRTGLSFA